MREQSEEDGERGEFIRGGSRGIDLTVVKLRLIRFRLVLSRK